MQGEPQPDPQQPGLGRRGRGAGPHRRRQPAGNNLFTLACEELDQVMATNIETLVSRYLWSI